jgi:serine/threonine-protein kinase
MELVEGETLTSRIGDARRLPWPDVATIIANVADVLTAVHTRGIVHRDLKPDNLLLTPGDRAFPVRVIDWGVARLGPIGRLTLEGLTPGTPIYMSPEQATGHHIAAPCDIYSLGVIAYEALCGHPPFDGRTLAEVVCKHITSEAVPLAGRCSAPAPLCALVHEMLDKDPTNRPMAVDVRKLAREIIQRHGYVAEAVPIEVIDGADCIEADAEVVDPDELEYGITQLLPAMRKPQWTPQLELPAKPRSLAITPKHIRDQVSGEIVARRHR